MTESELLAAVLASPDDLPLRLVYADFLQERGDPRGELITVQCKLYQLGAGRSDQRATLRERERALLEAHGQRWLAELGLEPGEGTFVRGLVERLWLKAHRVDLAAALAQKAPIRSIGLVRPAEPKEGAPAFDRMLQALQALPSLGALDLTGAPLEPEDVAALARVFDVSVPTPGDPWTVNVGQYWAGQAKLPFANRHAASLRAVYDLSDPEQSLFIYHTGQSGLVFSSRYRDMSQQWAQVGYRPLRLAPPAWAHEARLMP